MVQMILEQDVDRADAVAGAVVFTLVSPDGDQGCTGGVRATAPYSLLSVPSKEGGGGGRGR